MLKSKAQMNTNAFMYPQWTFLRPVWFEYSEGDGRTMTLEYKYAVSNGGGQLDGLSWESGAGNRQLVVPLSPGALWLVTDARFGDMSRASLVPTTMAEVKARWAKFVPDWANLPERARMHPDRYMLSPRIQTFELDDKCHFDIEREFHALSKLDSPKLGEPKFFEEPETDRYPPSESSSSCSHGFESKDEAHGDIDIDTAPDGDDDKGGAAEEHHVESHIICTDYDTEHHDEPEYELADDDSDDSHLVAEDSDDAHLVAEEDSDDGHSVAVEAEDSERGDDGMVAKELYDEAMTEVATLRAENEELREQLRLLAELEAERANLAVAVRAAAPRAAPEAPMSRVASAPASRGARPPTIAAKVAAQPSELAQVLQRRRQEVDSKAVHFTRETLGNMPSGRHGSPAVRSWSERGFGGR